MKFSADPDSLKRYESWQTGDLSLPDFLSSEVPLEISFARDRNL